MKKILLFTSILFLTISTSLFAQHPTNLDAINITSSSVDLSCDASICAGNIHYRYKVSSANTWTDNLNINSNTHQLFGLTPNTSYDWSVKCMGQSGWAATETFTTVSYGPSISNVIITDSIMCFDSTATLQISVNQTTPATPYATSIGILQSSGFFVSFGAGPVVSSSTISLPGYAEGIYTIRLVDSVAYYTANPFGNGFSTVGIYSQWDNLIITEPDILVASTITIDSNICALDCIAAQELTITGGTQPYNYTLNTDPTVILGPQSYDIVTVGTTFSPNILTINVGDTVTWTNTGGNHNVNATQVTFPNNPEGFGNSVGAGWSFQWIFTSAGTYDYQCDPHLPLGMTGVIIVNPSPSNTSTDTLANLCAGVYDLVVSDANGCLTSPATTTFQIDAIDAIVLAGIAETILLSPFHISCNGGSDGVINASASGGNGAFTYSINAVNFSSDNIFDSLTAGSYTITYKDANGCTDAESFTLDEPVLLELSLVVTTPASCFGLPDGIISVDVTGGVGGENYSTDTTGNSYPYGTGVLSSLLGDSTYAVFVMDGNGCIDSIHIPLSQPTEIVYSTTLSDYNGFEVSCFEASDGTIDFGTPTGGSGVGYTYSINAGTNYNPAQSYIGLPAGVVAGGDTIYNLSVKDSDGCKKDTNVVLVSPLELVISPVVTSNYNGSQISCFNSSNGIINVTQVNGVSPIEYEFDNTGGLSQISEWTSLSAGVYTVHAEDENGCFHDSIITISPPAPITAIINFIPEFCNNIDGEISLTTTGGTPFTGNIYTYDWTGLNGYTSSSEDISGLESGNYACIIADANNCSIGVSGIVIDDIPFELTLSTTTTCSGNSAGTATVTASALPGYSLGTTLAYAWESPLTQTSTVTGLALGSYTVIVNDPAILNCFISGTVSIDTAANAVGIASVEISQISCHDAGDGEIVIHASGGTAPYFYTLDSGTQQIDSVYASLTEGSHTIEVEDFSGCTFSQVINIINPATILIDTIIVNPITCSGGSDASIQAIFGSGGTLPYMYSVNGSLPHSNMAYFNSYSAGNYTVAISDINSCISSQLLTIADPSELIVTITPSNWYGNNYQIQCNGDTTSGFADIIVTGGVSPYNYTVLDINGTTITSSPNSHIDSLRAATYTFVITDVNGCPYTETITYFEPSEIQHNFIVTHVNCSGWNNGALIDSVYGGVGSATTYSYLWNNNEITHTIDSLAVGVYSIIVTDENNCASIDSIEVNDNNALAATLDVTDVSCFNFCDGEIMAVVTGGAPNINAGGMPVYSYQWNDTLTQTSQTALGLCVNNVTNSSTYSCVITDTQGCSISLFETIFQQDELVVTASILSEISCNLGSDGKLAATVTGGNSPYTYMWSNDAPSYLNNSPINNNLFANNYILTVKDFKGCFGETSVEIVEPSELTLTFDETNLMCYGFNDGQIIAVADSGTPFLGIPPEYLYTFYNVSGSVIFSQTTDTSTAQNLSPGIYTVVAEDRNGCTIESGTIYIAEPGDSLTISFNIKNSSCAQSNGEVNVDVYGGTPPYQYNWENGSTLEDITNLQSGIYPITITDALGCIITDSAFVQGVQNIFLPGNLTSIDSTVCLGATIFLEIEEKPNLNYVWENGSIIADRWVTPTAPITEYILSIIDPNCANSYKVTATITVMSADPLPSTNPLPENGSYATVIKGESIEIFANNMNCDTYQWSWITDTVGTRVIIDYPDASGWYYIAVDSADCLGFDSIYVVVGVLPYDAITPNGDTYNDTWNILGIASYPNAVVQVFNRWGALVHETPGGLAYVAWDGTREGEELPVGTYYYIIDLKTNDDPQSGPITIIR